MSARDDYPLLADWVQYKYGRLAKVAVEGIDALDEIDRLRRALDLSQGIGVRFVKMPQPEDDPA